MLLASLLGFCTESPAVSVLIKKDKAGGGGKKPLNGYISYQVGNSTAYSFQDDALFSSVVSYKRGTLDNTISKIFYRLVSLKTTQINLFYKKSPSKCTVVAHEKF